MRILRAKRKNLPRDPEPDLGPCCVCGKEDKTVRNVMMLAQKGEPGKGWGCLVCHLPLDGATAIVCDACLPGFEPGKLQTVVKGWAREKQRMPVAELSGETHAHDLRYHPEEWSCEPGGTLSPVAIAAAKAIANVEGDIEECLASPPMPLLLFYTHADGRVGMYNAGPFDQGYAYMKEAGWKWREGSLIPPAGVLF